jgi:hypothetical protein
MFSRPFRNIPQAGGQCMKESKMRAAALALAAGIALAAIVQGASAGGAAQGKSPRAVVERDTIRLGEVLEVQDIECTFKIKNVGDGELQILNVHPACGCSVAEFDKVIPPGKEGSVHTKIFGRQISPGEIAKAFSVKTNDPQKPEFVLVVMGNVKKVFDFSRELRWAGFADEDLKLECVITNLLPTPINILSARWVDGGVAKDLEDKIGLKVETIEKGRKYRLSTWKKGDLAPDDILADIALTTDFPKLKEKMVPVAVTIMRDVDLHPAKLYYGEMAMPSGATKTFERTFDIIAARGDSLKVIEAVPSRDDITVKIRELQPGKLYRGTVLVRPTSKVDRYTGAIKIYTNYPSCRELDLEIVGSVRTGQAGGRASRGGN